VVQPLPSWPEKIITIFKLCMWAVSSPSWRNTFGQLQFLPLWFYFNGR
jgi:hypothetical protein